MKQHLFFLGIAGFAMGGLALAARNRGYQVSGLDETAGPPMSDWLNEHKLTWSHEFSPVMLQDVDEVIVSGQHGSDTHPIILAARQQRLKISSFAELYGRLTEGRHVIAVAGAHGKTTTTSLLAWIFESAGRRPDYLVGIRPLNFDSSSRLDGSGLVIVEGDEYRASVFDNRAKFEYYHPDVLIITSIEHDHPDVFPDLQSVIGRFDKVVAAMPASGRVVAWTESPTVKSVVARAKCEVITYGLEAGDYIARDIAYLPTGIEFDIQTAKGIIGRLAVPLYGRHNVLNSLAATATALSDGLTLEQIQAGAATFKGIFRRFNFLSPAGSPVTVIDDYAHHPTEVKTTIEAAKLHFATKRLIAIYRPHTYSRIQALLTEYRTAFDRADIVYVTEIEPAREAVHEQTVSGQDIVKQAAHPHIAFEPDRARLVDRVAAQAQPGDVVLCMSVGIYEGLAEELAQRLGPK